MTGAITAPQSTGQRSRNHDREIKNSIESVRFRIGSQYRGSFRISNPNSSFFVSFKSYGLPNQADTTYEVLLSPIGIGLFPVSGAFVKKLVTKGVDGFLFETISAGGASTWVDWAWKIFDGNPSINAKPCFSDIGAPGTLTMAGTGIPTPSKTSQYSRSHDREVKSAIDRIKVILDSNFRGEALFEDLQSADFITFADIGLPDQVDTSYDVFATPIDVGNFPVTNSFIMTQVQRATTGFSIRIATAPGTGAFIRWGWKIFRYV